MKNDTQVFEDQDRIDIEQAASFAELALVAIRILERLGDTVGMVCGPISTGGLGSAEANLNRFCKAISVLQAHSHVVFDQMPFEDAIIRLKDCSVPYDTRILTEFYQVLFETGRIKKQYFIHDWPSSTGSRWEHEEARKRGVEIIYLTKDHLPQS